MTYWTIAFLDDAGRWNLLGGNDEPWLYTYADAADLLGTAYDREWEAGRARLQSVEVESYREMAA